MPKGSETVDVLILLDDDPRQVLDEILQLDLVTLTENGLPIAPDADGVHEIVVYINGKFWHRMTYNFDTGEQVDS